MGAGVTGEIRQEIENFCEHWPPILQAQRDGTLDLDSLSQDDREFLQNFNVPVIMAWGWAMLDWPSIEPADFRCPTLWLIGSQDQQAVDSVREYEQSLEGSRVQLYIVEGLNHNQVFEEIDKVFPTMMAFTQS
jgi:pimeloyl-ACP methyl ester carboxylesterase